MMTFSILAAALLQAAPPALVLPASSTLNDYNLNTDRAERTQVFARSEAEFRNARIMISTRRSPRVRWSAPQPIAFTDARWSDSDPWLTPDGRTLYFISTRPAHGREEGRADYDIWRSVRTATGWSAPEHLGPTVNSRGQELGPELHGGRLYFASARRSGRGGLDVYSAPVSGSGFGAASLLEGPVNSAASESDFTLSPDGRTALFWRSDAEQGTARIHVSYRTGGGWSEPTPLPGDINHGPFNFTPHFSADGRYIIYASTRRRDGQAEGLADVYRALLPGRPRPGQRR
jgi:dipeptidyl aminopeptidase/acylaminoacyl peptidase